MASDDIIDRARASIELWAATPGVTIEVHTGMVAAEDAYRNAPELVSEMAAEIERLRAEVEQHEINVRMLGH
ncbi:hypothetical protein H7J07_04875 [Mycobacterium koreense]|nr:hypothetical protein [Mycolicibacillus koreensis]MCV7247591.1 hypothetical protein [Mycolicibacillus koreensis]